MQKTKTKVFYYILELHVSITPTMILTKRLESFHANEIQYVRIGTEEKSKNKKKTVKFVEFLICKSAMQLPLSSVNLVLPAHTRTSDTYKVHTSTFDSRLAIGRHILNEVTLFRSVYVDL